MIPVATPPNLMIYGPGGYQFGDYWKLGLLCVVWFGVVVILVAPRSGSSKLHSELEKRHGHTLQIRAQHSQLRRA